MTGGARSHSPSPQSQGLMMQIFSKSRDYRALSGSHALHCTSIGHDISINRTHFAIPNILVVYITTSEIRTSH